jgi:hypothetical protein
MKIFKLPYLYYWSGYIVLIILYLVLLSRLREYESNTKKYTIVSDKELDVGSWLLERSNHYKEAMLEQAKQIKMLEERNFPELIESNKNFASLNKICEKASEYRDLPHPYFVYKPLWTCPYLERIGELFDGGKWLCNIHRLKNTENCVVYSFGSNFKVQFETQLQLRTGCNIYTFDPTSSYEKLPTNIHFYPWCIASTDGECKIGEKKYSSYSMPTIAKKLKHSRINLLKIDVDRYEWEIFDSLPSSFFHKLMKFQSSFTGLVWKNLSRL